jgi:threonine synthase
MLKILRDSGGGAVSVSESEIQEAQRLVARVEGIWTAPESAALVAALQRLRDERTVTRDAEIVMVFTGAGIKYDPPTLPAPVDLAGSDTEIVEQVRRAIAH